MDSSLSADRMLRYQAHLALPEFGPAAQRRLLASRVLVIGVGGLGCPIAQYLAAAGVGTLGLADDDTVDATNLQRQVLYTTADVGRSKVDAAGERLSAMNGDVDVRLHPARVAASNVTELVAAYDLVLDGSDNFATRYVVNDACVLAHLPLITGSLYRFDGQVTVIDPPATGCYRCLFPSAAEDAAPCHDAGVLGPLAGIVGTIQAAEAIAHLVRGSSSLRGRLLLVDAATMAFRVVQLRRDPGCALCGDAPTIERPTAATATGA